MRVTDVTTPGPEDASKSSRALAGYCEGLDGVRGVAMFMVLAYHAEFSWAKGAFLGLSQFFTLSGFLITSILLRSHERGGVSLRHFWARRYRRLLPAALLTLAGVVVFGATVATQTQAEQLPGQVTAALAQMTNWYFIVADQSYIALFDAPSPIHHMWSLAVEEQFYLVMPVALVFVLRRTSSMKVVGAMFAVGALASTAWMIWLHEGGATLDRIYLGTDTRAAEFLVGGLLAVVLHRFDLSPGPRGRLGFGALGVVVFGVSFAGMVLLPLRDGVMWEGGMLVFSLVTSLLIVCLLVGAGPVSAILSLAPLAALGRISYGVYLCHWPIYLWLDEERTGLDQWPLFALRLVVVLSLATLSYNVLEMRVRDGYHLGLPAPAFRALLPVSAVVIIGGALLVSTREVVETDPLLVESAGPDGPPVSDGVMDVLVVSDAASDPLVDRALASAVESGEVRVVAEVPFGCGSVTESADGPTCDEWGATWRSSIEEHDPDVTLLAVQRWDPAELAALAGTVPTDPGLDEWTEQLVGSGIDLLTAGGSRVVWPRIPLGLQEELQVGAEPFDVAMDRLVTSRSDLRKSLGGEPRPLEPGEELLDVQAEMVLDDLELYAREDAGGTRVLVVGDSVAWTLGVGLEAWGAKEGTATVWNAATKGCGLAQGGTVREMSGREGPLSATCTTLEEGWRRQIQEFDPDVVLVVTTVADLQERRLDGWSEYLRPGDATFDEYLVDEFTQAVDILSSGGAHIVWATVPCSGEPPPIVSPGPFELERAQHANEVILPRLVEARPDDVELLDLFSLVCPDGEFTEDVAGIDDLRPDGVHFSADGSDWFAATEGAAIVDSASG